MSDLSQDTNSQDSMAVSATPDDNRGVGAIPPRLRDFTALLCIWLVVLGALWIAGFLSPVAAGLAWAGAAVAVSLYMGLVPGALDRASGVRRDMFATPEQVDRDVLDVLPFPALRIDRAGKIAATNDGARHLLRMGDRKAPRASTIIRSPALLNAIDVARAHGSPSAVVLKLGEMAQETWRASVSRVTGESDLFIVFENLTAVVRATQARSDFLANASHELRTPLTALSGYIETMRGPARDDPESWDRFLAIMQGETERMNRLVADLLSLSRIEFSEHQMPEDIEPFGEIVDSGVTALRPVAAEREITLDILAGAGDAHVTGDHDELIQVVENLLSNALKYSPNGATISISTGVSGSWTDAREDAARQWPDSERMNLLSPSTPIDAVAPVVWLRVADAGSGISRQHLPRLGERFYRADASRGGNISGTGLGLAIVKHIMTRHRGGLSVESIEGSGSAFGIWLPKVDPLPVGASVLETEKKEEVPGEPDTS